MSTFQKSAKVVYTFIMKTHFPFMPNKIGVTPFYLLERTSSNG